MARRRGRRVGRLRGRSELLLAPMGDETGSQSYRSLTVYPYPGDSLFSPRFELFPFLVPSTSRINRLVA